MNAVEIEEAISALAELPFDAEEFPFAFLLAFGNKATTIKRLRSGTSNKSDRGGLLQTNNIHLKVCTAGEVTNALAQLKASPATTKAKAKFILATDGQTLEAEDMKTGETIACDYTKFPDHFGFFLPLAGISTVTQIRESAFDIKATGRLNRLYIELLKDNPDWGTAARRHDMNHFMARLIFLFFAEDTSILNGDDLFTTTVTQMSAKDSSNTHEVMSELFRAMNVDGPDRATANLPNWADKFPYVNGGLFSGSTDVPKFSKIARSYLLHIGNLDWTKINPDIFGSMIQAVADDEERGALGMHYTSVPNILKVLNPLFLDDLRAQLDAAGDSKAKLKTLRTRISKIRVFDPACGSGNFLVIAYKELRSIEAKINAYSGEADRRTDIPLTNYRGIELRDFPAEVARLALIIAEYQCDVTYRGHKDALEAFLPLDAENWITQGNALRLDWLTVCPPTDKAVEMRGEDLFMSPLEKAQIDFKNEGGETYICGNPPFKGARKQNPEQKSDMAHVFGGGNDYKDCDYVAGWYLKAADFLDATEGSIAFVSTSSVCEGEQVQHIWSRVFERGAKITFAHRPFSWRNNASNLAMVTCVIVGFGKKNAPTQGIYDNETFKRCEAISPYLVAGEPMFVSSQKRPIASNLNAIVSGSMPRDGGQLLLSSREKHTLVKASPQSAQFLKKYSGTSELTNGTIRWCLWIEDECLEEALRVPEISERIDAVREMRLSSSAKTTNAYASIPHKFAQRSHKHGDAIIVSATSSQNREYIPADWIDESVVVSNAAYAVYGGALYEFACLTSRLHLVWIATVCGRMKTDYRYSKTLGWNTFPVPKLTEKNRADLTRCATDILLAREAHFPATIADLYKPDAMPANLRAAHARNDEVLERIYIGRRFRNDTERLEKLFELYTKMTTKVGAA
ncbi:MAG TPA: lactate dehydrogenase [Octadecabacter sp.]|nr:lactate dehydrogenase [Octadecabacter sp.]